MANSVDPDQTAPIGAAVLGPHFLLVYFNLPVMLGNYLQQTSSADYIFRSSLPKHYLNPNKRTLKIYFVRPDIIKSHEYIFQTIKLHTVNPRNFYETLQI